MNRKKVAPTKDFHGAWFDTRVAFERDQHGYVRARIVATRYKRWHPLFWGHWLSALGRVLWGKARGRR